MEKGRGERTDTLQTDNVFTRKEYIEREAAIKRFTFATLDCLGMEPTIMAADVVKALKAIPAADVAPVVRCKDCRKGIPDSEHATAYSCYGIWHKPDWFCAGGTRKDGDGERAY